MRKLVKQNSDSGYLHNRLSKLSHTHHRTAIGPMTSMKRLAIPAIIQKSN